MGRCGLVDGAFAEVAHLWCLYHLADPEIMPDGYSPSSFDAEEAAEIVAAVFEQVEVERWDGMFSSLQTREEVRAYCRHNYIPTERAEHADLPLWLTKRGVLVRAAKPQTT